MELQCRHLDARCEARGVVDIEVDVGGAGRLGDLHLLEGVGKPPGSCFWKNGLLLPVGRRTQRQRPLGDMAQHGFGDGVVVSDKLRLGNLAVFVDDFVGACEPDAQALGDSDAHVVGEGQRFHSLALRFCPGPGRIWPCSDRRILWQLKLHLAGLLVAAEAEEGRVTHDSVRREFSEGYFGDEFGRDPVRRRTMSRGAFSNGFVLRARRRAISVIAAASLVFQPVPTRP